jgi:hypothetical protein
MAKTLSNAQHQSLLLILGVLSELSTSETRPTQKAALSYCTANLLDIVAPPKPPTPPASQAAPPAAPVLTITEVDGPTPPIRAHAHDAAVKAAATRKANKTKAAGTGERIGANTKAPAWSDGPAPTTDFTADSGAGDS